MYKISIDEIVDYSKCPMYYFFKYKSGLPNDSYDIIEKYEEDINKIIYYAFYKYQEGEIIRLEDLKQMWGRLWIKDKRKSNLIFSDSYINKDTYNTKRVKGLESLLNFRNFLIDSPSYPILINQDYSIKIDDIIVSGKFDVVREIDNAVGEKEIQVCLFRSERDVPKLTQKYDLKLHCDTYAIENMINKNLDMSYLIYYFEKNKSIVRSDISSNKEMFLHNIKTITKLIKENVFYMSVNDNCQKCTFKNKCSSKSNVNKILEFK